MTESTQPQRKLLPFILVILITALATAVIAYLLVSIFTHKAEEKRQYIRLVDVGEDTTDPKPWGVNWPRQYDAYLKTADNQFTKYGGSEAMPEQRLDKDPWMRRFYAGYAFSIDFRERRGHAYMLYDQEQTERVTKRPQPGACLHCHASVMPTFREAGNGDVMKGFAEVCKMTYQDASALLKKVGSKSPDGNVAEGGHPVSCVDCHDPKSMELRVTRPGFIQGIAALAASDAATPHIPSIDRWRKGSKANPFDPNKDATRQEMRSFVCGQCHVEYYCGPKTTLFFPWGKGLKVEQIEEHYDNFKFPDGHTFFDWKHAETGAELLKAQHPEYEMWSQGIHARSGVACADCHMPYHREGATKISDHQVRSPLLQINHACQVCHKFPEDELMQRVQAIQDRNHDLMQRSAKTLIEMLDAIKAAKTAGATDDQLADVFKLQRKAQWRLDFVSSENSMGFHAPQEAARILGESIDYFRQAQLAAMKAGPAKVAAAPAQ